MDAGRIVVLGGGYAGLAVVREVRRRLPAPSHPILLIDASPFHTVKTRLHELVAYPERSRFVHLPMEILTRASRASFLEASVQGVDLARRKVVTNRGRETYDRLVITLGGRTSYRGVRGARTNTVSLQSFGEAMACVRRLESLGLFEARSPARRLLVCGAGTEGVEVAAMLRQRFPPERCEILLLDRNTEVLQRSSCGPGQRSYVRRRLEDRSVGLMLGASVRSVSRQGVTLASGDRIACDLVIWCLGVQQTEIRGFPLSPPLPFTPSLQHPDHPEVFGTGDFATVDETDPRSNLLSAQRALQHARVVAENLHRQERRRALRPARYRPRGELIGLGDRDGAGVVGDLPVYGMPAALIKKANEMKYLAELFRDVPRHTAQELLRAAREALPGASGRASV